MHNPLVSIIIPTYNRACLLAETLDSILAQTYTNWECIVVDDGSTDDTDKVMADYCREDERFQYHHRPEERLPGGNAARNYGFKVSKGEFVNWFDDDDVMLKEFLETKINGFKTHTKFVIASHYLVDEDLNYPKFEELEETSYLFKDYLLWKLRIITNSILFRKAYLLKTTLFDENISKGQETELFSRLFFRIKKDSYKVLNTPLFLYRQHNNRISDASLKYVKPYKSSQSYTAIENFKKSIILQDHVLINSLYKYIIDAFFRSVENKDQKNAKFVLDNLIPLLKSSDNRLLVFEIKLFGHLFLLLSRGVYKVEKRWKSKKINM
ncbi:glycosyltransferase [Tamlana agarivorans]|uniref:Glycosyltransferase n=1 Tax=Pseudotamlana agarivorans TaxID=481183 RepID=A0ACC5UCW6_9FLAO|nr:glycosyltransferase family 2 protein [Tamlana agarivorans]MBU2952155.1 glycosyltransferase [Tamlana agarivorans]